ncbi:hypothetical protein KHS38_07230 [Mucilaginibacter sp. Bleaf8]|uniref:hypothetical protein n=1 Tax=Mucilaginibacter sp. Bleaf8 TaxID=2834430 RepID=UPI001BCEE187|nr:hypothetical protein [Mucilaginibacter sp. Bleaf8]MBS7564194.1 hypothetical protein [Mucilaginibacter sp. Bleaf8]
MEYFKKRLNIALVTTAIMLFVNIAVWAQAKPRHHKAEPNQSSGYAAFRQLAEEAGADFKFPKGFKEIKVPNNEDFSFDYGMTLPGHDFEIWLEMKPLARNWQSYERTKGISGSEQANPDSLYKDVLNAYAMQLSGDSRYFTRNLTEEALQQYNADAGKTYLINLADSPDTRHYQYALLIAVQKDHVGTIIALCLTNDKGPGFFKNVSLARNCLRFK